MIIKAGCWTTWPCLGSLECSSWPSLCPPPLFTFQFECHIKFSVSPFCSSSNRWLCMAWCTHAHQQSSCLLPLFTFQFECHIKFSVSPFVAPPPVAVHGMMHTCHQQVFLSLPLFTFQFECHIKFSVSPFVAPHRWLCMT